MEKPVRSCTQNDENMHADAHYKKQPCFYSLAGAHPAAHYTVRSSRSSSPVHLVALCLLRCMPILQSAKRQDQDQFLRSAAINWSTLLYACCRCIIPGVLGLSTNTGQWGISSEFSGAVNFLNDIIKCGIDQQTKRGNQVCWIIHMQQTNRPRLTLHALQQYYRNGFCNRYNLFSENLSDRWFFNWSNNNFPLKLFVVLSQKCALLCARHTYMAHPLLKPAFDSLLIPAIKIFCTVPQVDNKLLWIFVVHIVLILVSCSNII